MRDQFKERKKTAHVTAYRVLIRCCAIKGRYTSQMTHRRDVMFISITHLRDMKYKLYYSDLLSILKVAFKYPISTWLIFTLTLFNESDMSISRYYFLNQYQNFKTHYQVFKSYNVDFGIRLLYINNRQRTFWMN